MASSNPLKYTFFWGAGSPFSQFHKCKFTVEGLIYNCAEQYMMHQKAVLFGDNAIADKIMKSTSQKQQKSFGRKVSNFNQDIWDENSRKIVYKGNFAKFSQNEDLKQKLLDTEGTTLVEASPDDKIWGIGYAEDHPNAKDETKWQGENRLGYILTEVREAILREELSCDTKHSTTQSNVTADSTDQNDPKMYEDKFKSSTGKSDAACSDHEKYTFFWKSESPFSQWYKCRFSVEGTCYNCAEQFMMQQKAVLFGDREIAAQIMQTDSPRKQKSLGRKVSNFSETVWNENCQKIVYKGNLAKFSQNEDLREILLNTKGTVLAEASPVDAIWGIGYTEDNPKAKQRKTWRGQNLLGFILTDVREAILRGELLLQDG